MPEPTGTIWSGVFDILEIPGAEVIEEASTITSTVTLEGPWASCMESRPRVGETLADANGIRYPGIIRKTVLHHLEGDVGQIVCTLVDETQTTDKQLGPTRYEVRYETYQKALEQHPIFNGGNADFAGIATFGKMSDELTVDTKALAAESEETRAIAERLFGDITKETTMTYAQLVQLLKSASPAERACVYTFTRDGGTKPEPFLRRFFEKWDAGIEGYEEVYPVATQTTPYSSPRKPGKVNVLNTPTGFGNALPTGYTWLKTTDTSTWTGPAGACENIQSWKGLKDPDPDLFKKG